MPRAVPTNYFTRRQFQQLVAATQRYEYGSGFDYKYRGRRILTLLLLMRWSGLSIRDAVGLARDVMDENGALFLRRAKTGVHVYVPLPPAVRSLLRALPWLSDTYFFWSGRGKIRSAVGGYSRSLKKLFGLADIRNEDRTLKRCASHMFRDTFAVEMLLAAVPIDQIAALLGHRSIKMTEKHYLPWVKARQRQLTASVRRAWFPEVRQAPAPERREFEEESMNRPAPKSHWFKPYICVSPPAVHPFFLGL